MRTSTEYRKEADGYVQKAEGVTDPGSARLRTTGVADDEEPERLSDFDLVGGERRPLVTAGHQGRMHEGAQPRLCAAQPRLCAHI
jgi:hypothetical protein